MPHGPPTRPGVSRGSRWKLAGRPAPRWQRDWDPPRGPAWKVLWDNGLGPPATSRPLACPDPTSPPTGPQLLLVDASQLSSLTGFALISESRDPSSPPVATDAFTRMKSQLLRIQDLVPHGRPQGSKSLCKQERGHILISAAPPGAQGGRGPGVITGSGHSPSGEAREALALPSPTRPRF